MQLDDLRWLGFAAGYKTAKNAATWATDQFVAWYMLYWGADPSVKPFDGLDNMLLLSWVRRKFVGSDDQPFVLHYWDLRLPNILIDEGNNLLA